MPGNYTYSFILLMKLVAEWNVIQNMHYLLQKESGRRVTDTTEKQSFIFL